MENFKSLLNKYKVPIILSCSLLALVVCFTTARVFGNQNAKYYEEERILADETDPPLVLVSCSPSSIYANGTSTCTTTLGGSPLSSGVSYTSSNTSVAQVSASGVVTGITSGTTTITATYNNALSATTTVTVVPKETCSITVSTPYKKVSVDETYRVNVKISDGCDGTDIDNVIQKVSYTCNNVKNGECGNWSTALKEVKGGDIYYFDVLPARSCEPSSVTVSLQEDNKSGIAKIEQVETPWQEHSGSWRKEIVADEPTSSGRANIDGKNVYYDTLTVCKDDEEEQCYTKRYTRGCGTTEPDPSPTYACYKNADGTEFKWATSAPESSWTKVSEKTKDTCKACFVNSSTNDYKWATSSPGTGYSVNDALTTEGSCVAPKVCFVNTATNDYKWATSSPGEGYVISTTITSEETCVSPIVPPQEIYACYKNDNNDYKWASSAPDGYTLVSDITEEADCKYVVEVPATAATVAGVIYVAVIVMLIVGGSLVYIYKDKLFNLN